MTDLPVQLADPLAAVLAGALDGEGKIVRALEALGPIRDRDVVLIGVDGGIRAGALEAAGARLRVVDDLATSAVEPQSADVVVAWWSAFRGLGDGELGRADEVLRPGGRLLIIHDYGRDDVSRLRGDLPEYGAWSRRDGPFLAAGFKIRVLHCWWSFESVEEARSFLEAAFGARGVEVGAELKRPRLSYNVAVYHRTRGDGATS